MVKSVINAIRAQTKSS